MWWRDSTAGIPRGAWLNMLVLHSEAQFLCHDKYKDKDYLICYCMILYNLIILCILFLTISFFVLFSQDDEVGFAYVSQREARPSLYEHQTIYYLSWPNYLWDSLGNVLMLFFWNFKILWRRPVLVTNLLFFLISGYWSTCLHLEYYTKL